MNLHTYICAVTPTPHELHAVHLCWATGGMQVQAQAAPDAGFEYFSPALAYRVAVMGSCSVLHSCTLGYDHERHNVWKKTP